MTAHQGRHFLQIPGPSPVPDRVLRAMDMPVIDHRSAEFGELGRTVLEGPPLTLPHPRAAERLFVMGPLAELAPGWVHPLTGATAEQLASWAPIGQDAAPQ